MAHRRDQSTRAIHRSGYRACFVSQWFLLFIKNTKPTKEDPVTLVQDRHYSHTRNLEVITFARENHVDIICLPPHSSHKTQPFVKAFMGPLKTFYCQEIGKWLRSHKERVTGEQYGNSYKWAATGEIAVNDFQVTGLFPCDKNIFRPYDFPLSSADKDAASVNHPALVKTRDQPSFSSDNFSPFTSAYALRSSDISPVPNLNLKPNPRGGTAQKITSWGNSERKPNRPLNPNKSVCIEYSSWSLKKTEKKDLPLSNSLWQSTFGHWPSCSFRRQFDGRR